MSSVQTDRRQGLNSSAAIKVPVKTASSGLLVASGEQTISGVACVTGDRVLRKDETDQTLNGIWVVDTGNWTRDLDFDGAYDARKGTTVRVLGGTEAGWWACTTAEPITIGTSNLTFARDLVSDSSTINFTQAGVGAVTRSAQDKMRDIASIKDFGAAADWNGATGTDDTAAIQTAVTAAIANKYALFFPGMSKITSPILVPADTRGLQLYGVDRRNTGLHNANVAGGTALQIGDTGLVTASYDIVVKDFRIEGNGGYTDGKGLALYYVLQSHFENIMTEYTGSDGIYEDTCFQNTWLNTHTRRAGYNTASATIAGVHIKNTSGHYHQNHISEECANGVIEDNSGVEWLKLDTEQNQVKGVYKINGGNTRFTNSYAEGDDWYIGDGVTAVDDAHFVGCNFGAGVNVILNKVNYYNFVDCGAQYPYLTVQVVDPNNTKGHLDLFSNYLYNAAQPYSFYTQHIPASDHSGNLIRNGSFEIGSVATLAPGWTVTLGGTAAATLSYVTGSSHDRGTRALQLVVTGCSGGAGTVTLTPNAPQLLTGGTLTEKIFTLEFSDRASVTNGLTFNVWTNPGPIKHFNSAGIPASTAAGVNWDHWVAQFRAAGSINALNFQIVEDGTYALDSVSLYEGVKVQQHTLSADDTGLETAYYGALLAPAAATVHAATQVYTNVTAFAAQPDVPRNLTYTASAAAAAGNITVTGRDWRGQEVTFTDAITGGGATNTSAYALIAVDKITGYDAGAGQTLSVGIGSLIGLPKSCAAVIKMKKNNADVALPTLDLSKNTLDLSGVGIAGADSFTFWYLH